LYCLRASLLFQPNHGWRNVQGPRLLTVELDLTTLITAHADAQVRGLPHFIITALAINNP
jgi:hypothetical protein